MSLQPRAQLYSDPPPAQDIYQVNPTLLVSWWCTGFALVIILFRLAGRWVRTEKMFKEDKIMALSIIPLVGRMAVAHVVIRWGTNNVVTEGLSDQEIYQREIGSKLVLLSRILYAAFIWIAKFTIAEFLRRTYSGMWRRSYQTCLLIIRWFLLLTFVGVVVSTNVECQPYNHYWQVTPDPGPQCRQGAVQLLTMGTTDIITDVVLVIFPIPIVMASNMHIQRKLSLVALFSLSLILVAITSYRVQAVISHHMDQPFRSLLASVEMLAAAAVSNALVLGSFVRDRGIKKAKFKFGSAGGDSSLDRPNLASQRARSRSHHRALSWGSDIDLVADVGMRLGPEFSELKAKVARPAPAVVLPFPEDQMSPGQQAWTFAGRGSVDSDVDADLMKHGLSPEFGDAISPMHSHQHMGTASGPRRMSFFDVGGLLGKTPTRSSFGLPPDSPTLDAGQNISMQPLLSSTRRQQDYFFNMNNLMDDGDVSPPRPPPPRPSPERSPRSGITAASSRLVRNVSRSLSPPKETTHGGGTWL